MTVKLVAALVGRLRVANERISRQSFQTVPSRVAGVLSQLVAEEAPRTTDGGEVTIRMNQADLAQLAGTSWGGGHTPHERVRPRPAGRPLAEAGQPFPRRRRARRHRAPRPRPRHRARPA